MKVYLVGGAVRDQLLQLPVTERDWVVVGSTPAKMLNLGFKQVGRDFPVFLHPKTQEEYALARTERKSGSGYCGFLCDFSHEVSLHDDLARRDLTINAMAQDESGQLIDPYHGLADLKAKRLRHVSNAFVEDPVRVLRVARFAARFHHLGFVLADETRLLMYQMMRRGELAYLVAERVWQEWQRSLTSKNPEMFIRTLRACGALKKIIPELDALFGIPGSKRFHPEIDTGVHTLMALCKVVELSDDPIVRLGVLMHDLGKACTPFSQWPSHKGHEAAGVPVIEALCERLRIPTVYRDFAVMVARFHLKIHDVSNLSADEMVSVLEQTDAFRKPSRFHNLLIACEADALGIGRKVDYNQANQWRALFTTCGSVQAKTVMDEGAKGAEIKAALHARRVNLLEQP